MANFKCDFWAIHIADFARIQGNLLPGSPVTPDAAEGSNRGWPQRGTKRHKKVELDQSVVCVSLCFFVAIMSSGFEIHDACRHYRF
jgi:hypothetical protein